MKCPQCKAENREDRAACYHCEQDLTMLRTVVSRIRSHFNTALEHAERDRADEAIAELNHALELDSTFVDAWVVLGTLYARMEKFDSTSAQELEGRIELLKKAVGLDPSVARYKRDLAISYYNRENYDKCIEWAREAAKTDPSDSMNHTLIGAAFFSDARYDEARQAHAKALEINPANHFSRYNFAITLQALEAPGAAEAWEEFLRRTEDDSHHGENRKRAREFLNSLKTRVGR